MKSKEMIIEELEPKNVNFMVDKFEELILQDTTNFDESTRIKLNRNLTKFFNNWLNTKLKLKEQAKINIMGETRTNIKGTKILMSDFSLKNIEDIKEGDLVFAFNENTYKYEIKPVIEVYEKTYKELYKIKTINNREIISSIKHKFLITKPIKRKVIKLENQDKKYKSYFEFEKPSWKELKDISIGDYIAVPYNLGRFGKKTNIPIPELKLLGFWLGDGYFYKDERAVIEVSKKWKKEYLEKLEKESKNDWKFRINLNYTRLHKEKNWNKGYKYNLTKKEEFRDKKRKDYFSQLIIDLGLHNKKCDTKFIPDIIKQATEPELYALLSGLFSSDGYVDINKKILVYSTTSKQLIDDLKIILIKLGIPFNSFSRKQKKKYKKSYFISIQGKSYLEQLLNKCDFNNNLKEKLELIINSKSRQNFDYYIKGDLMFVRIQDIKNIGKQEAYDFQVQDNHNYIANFIVSSNSGKTLVGIRILQMINQYYGYEFNPEFQITANQKEYRINIQKAEFGMPFQVDENAFTKTGVGSMTEAHQLKDIQNITAKKNIHTIFITPEVFLPTGATIGLKSFGKDLNNYVSRFLVYSLKGSISVLLGYVIFNVGKNYQNTGCFIYKQIGGCNNVNKVKATDIDKDYLRVSSCISDEYKTDEKLRELEQKNIASKEYRCPFYDICMSGMCAYEHKKDKWIEKELKGGLDERDKERYLTALKVFEDIAYISEDNNIKLKAKNGKELKIKIKMKIPKFTNTKFTGVEIDEIMQLVISMTDTEFLQDVCKNIEVDYEKFIEKMINNSNF